jgi:ribosomal protein S27AE
VGLLHEWRRCPRCGAPVVPRDGRAECAACGYVAYANPAPAACALCVDDSGRILLTRRAWEPYAGNWFARDELPPIEEVAIAEPLAAWLEQA